MAYDPNNPYGVPEYTDTSLYDLPQDFVDFARSEESWSEPIPAEVIARQLQQRRELARQRIVDQELIRQSQARGQREQLAKAQRDLYHELEAKQPAPVQPKVEISPEEPGLLGAIKRGLKAPGREIDAVSLNAQAADALDNPIKLADLALQKKKLDEGASTSQKGFRSGIKSDGSFYDYLASLFGSAKANPEGALESTVEFATNAALTFVVPELVGAGVGALAGGVGAVAAGPAVVGGVQAVLSSGEMGMAMMLKQAQQDGIDLTNKSQVAEWVKTKGVKDVYGKAQAGGLTNGAVIALTLGLAKYAGSVSKGLLGESRQTVAKAQEAGPLTPAMVGQAEAQGNTLLNQARLAKGGEIAAGTVGFGAASALSSKAAGEEVDDNSVFANAMMYMVPSLFGVRPYVRGLKVDNTTVPPPQRGTTTPLKKPPGGGGDKTTAELDEAFIAGQEQKPKSNAAKAVAEVNGTPEEQAAIVTSINNLTPFERAELAATAIQTVRPENIEAAHEEIKAEAAKRAGATADKLAAETGAIDATKPAVAATDIGTTPSGDVATAGEVRLAEDGTVQQGARGEVTTGPGGSADIVSNQEGILEGPARQPDSGRPTGDTSGGSPTVTSESLVPSGDASGKAGVVGDFAHGWEAADTSTLEGIYNRPPFPPAIDTVIRSNKSTGQQLIKWFINRHEDPAIRALAKAMQPALEAFPKPIRIKVQEVLTDDGQRARGSSNTGTGIVKLDPEMGVNAETLFHELAHMITVEVVTNPRPHQMEAVAEMNHLFEQVKATATPAFEPYAFKNVKEFIAEAHANPIFRNALRQLTIREPLKSGIRNAWDKFKEIVVKLIFGRVKVPKTVLDRVLEVSGELYEGRQAGEINYAADTAKRIDKEGAGDILGRDAQGNIKYRAWDNHDGTFRVYEVTPAEPMDDPKLHIEVNEANLKDFITNKGLEFVNRTAEGFDAEPVPSKNLIVRWRAGPDGKSTAVFMAKPDENGMWRAQVGEDLTTRGSTREYFDYPTKRDALEAANKESPHDTKQVADADGEASQVRDILTGAEVSNVVVPGDPSWLMKGMMDAKAAVRYVAGATDEFMKRIGAELPPGMRLGVEYMLKASDLSRAWREMLSNEADPLIKSTREFVSKYDTYYKGEEGYKQLNRDVSDLVAVERLPKLRAKYSPTLDPKYAAENVAKEQAAKQRLQNLEQQHPGITADLTALMKEWKPFSDKTIDIMYEHNRISKDTRDRIKNAYQIYAPLISEKKGTRKLTATGTSAEGSNVFERMIEARGSALKNGIDNEAMRVLVKLIRTFDYRNKDGSKIFKITKEDNEHLKHDPVTGIIDVTTEMNPRKSIVYYEGGVPHRIEINNPALEKALSKFSEADADTALRKAIGAAGFFTRMFGVLHTSASPPFALRNFVRDLATNAAQLDPRISYTEFRKAMFDPEVWGAAFRLGFREAYSLTGKDSIKGSKLADAADRDGALIDRRFQYGVDQLPTQHRVSLRPSTITHAKELFGPTDGKILNFLTGITHSLEAVNRIAVYKAAKESGIDGREAGVLSKNATTNFERRGEYMHNISPFYAFANAKMQGARTLAENLGFTQLRGRNAGGITQGLRGLAGGRIADSANVRTVRAAQMAIGLGLAAAYLNYKSSPKDKDGRTTYGKRSEYQLDEYLHIPGLDIDLPIPQELGTFYNMGSSMGDWLFGDRSGSASGAMTRFITSTIQNFSPGGTSMHDPIGPNGEGADYAFRLAMPTQALAVYDIVTNRDTFGREINPQKGRKDIPPEMQGAAKASQPANMLTQGLHKVGVDTSPKYIDHFLLNMFKQQQPLYNAVTQGAVGALVSNTFKSFRQEVYPGTTKLDYDTISQQVEQDAAREAGSPLKKKQYTGLAREFANTDEQIKKLREAYNKAKTDEQRKAVDEKQNDLRMKVLKKYYEAKDIVQPLTNP